MNCIQCNKTTNNLKFCSRSCAAKFNNKKYPKRKLTKCCHTCNTRVLYNRKFCNNCLLICPIHKLLRKTYKNGKRKCIKCTTKNQTKHRRNKTLRLKAMAGNKCQICNYSKSIRGLHFHHLDPKTKEFNISHGNNHSFKLMCNEASKCILICANCHAEVHEGTTAVTGVEPAIFSLTN